MGEKHINYTINSLKFVCAILVIFIHYKFVGQMGEIVAAIGRISVPFFFICSGFFCFYTEPGKLLKKLPSKLKHILIITVITITCYFIWGCILRIFGSSGDIKHWLFEELFTLRSLVYWLIFNSDYVAGPFWFLYALLYCYLFMYLIERFNLYKVAAVFIPITLCVNLVLGEFLKIWDINIGLGYYRNYWLCGFPFFMIGYFLHKNIHLFLNKVAKLLSCALFVLGIVLSLVEAFFIGECELYVGSVCAVCGIFILALNFPNVKLGGCAEMGKKLSLYMYCIHWFLCDFAYIIAKWIGVSGQMWWGYVCPIVIVIVSIIVSVVFEMAISFLCKKLEAKKRVYNE